MAEFDYMIEAGLYTGKTLRSSCGPRYKRFETAAETGCVLPWKTCPVRNCAAVCWK